MKPVDLFVLGKKVRKTKMKIILVFALLSIASSRCVELEKICSSDSFDFENVEVNAFYRSQSWNVTFQGLNYYLINKTADCNSTEFYDEDNIKIALRIKEE